MIDEKMGTRPGASGVRAGAFLLLAACLAGCPSPNVYGTPRTVAEDKTSFTIAAEGIAVTEVGRERTETEATALPPTFVVRRGLGPRTDLGFRVGRTGNLGFDLKVNPVRGDVDFGFAPGFEFELDTILRLGRDRDEGGYFAGWAHLPVLLGFNMGRHATAFFTAGLTLKTYSRDVDPLFRGANDPVEPFLRGGFGLSFHTRGFEVTPEATLLWDPVHDEGMTIFGLGFGWGAIPSYDDVGAAR